MSREAPAYGTRLQGRALRHRCVAWHGPAPRRPELVVARGVHPLDRGLAPKDCEMITPQALLEAPDLTRIYSTDSKAKVRVAESK